MTFIELFDKHFAEVTLVVVITIFAAASFALRTKGERHDDEG